MRYLIAFGAWLLLVVAVAIMLVLFAGLLGLGVGVVVKSFNWVIQ